VTEFSISLLGAFEFVVVSVAAGLFTCDVAGPFLVPLLPPPLSAKAYDDATDTAMIKVAIAVAAFTI
jgi:hypothetical protein